MSDEKPDEKYSKMMWEPLTLFDEDEVRELMTWIKENLTPAEIENFIDYQEENYDIEIVSIGGSINARWCDEENECMICGKLYDDCTCEKDGFCDKCPKRCNCYLDYDEDLYDGAKDRDFNVW